MFKITKDTTFLNVSDGVANPVRRAVLTDSTKFVKLNADLLRQKIGFFHKKRGKKMTNDMKALISSILTILVVSPTAVYLFIGVMNHTIDLAGVLGIIAFLTIILVAFVRYLDHLAKQNGWN